MCGIVGYIGDKNAVEIIMAGLHRLEYRGYDSAGVAVVRNGKLDCVKSLGKLVVMDKKLAESDLSGPSASATPAGPRTASRAKSIHTRISTGQKRSPSSITASSRTTRNSAMSLRRKASSSAARRTPKPSPTSFASTTRATCSPPSSARFKTSKAPTPSASSAKTNPDLLVAARHGSPLIVGLGKDEGFIASDVPAIMKFTRKVLYIDNGQVCEISRDGYKIEDVDGNPVKLEVKTVDWDDAAAEKEGYPHFMLKEINQQPDVIRNTLRGRVTRVRTRST